MLLADAGNFLIGDNLKTNQEADGLRKSSPETIGSWKGS